MRIFLLLVIAAFFIACEKTEDSNCETLITDVSDFNVSGLAVDSLSYMNGELSMKVGYSGCNNDHDIDLIWDGFLLESFPLQASILVVDNNQDELCQAFFIQEECFDMRPLLDALPDGEEVILRFMQSTTSIRIKK